METLTAPSIKVFLENHRDKDRGLCSPTSKAAGFRVFGYQYYANPRFSLSVSLHRKIIRPFCSAPALSSSETETCVENEEIPNKDMTQSKTVHVKFQLRRECKFGQQFLIVGNDPMFGLWDPSNAVPLNWSEGNVWTIELDMPCDKVIKYKFILKGDSNTITWQPDPDRMLQTWETRNTIAVCEDWENAELQTIIEEDPIAHQLTQSINNSELLIVTENLLEPGGDPTSDVNEKPTITNGYPMLSKKPLAGSPMAIVAENITGQNEEVEVATSGISSQRSATPTSKAVTVGANNFQNNEMTPDSATGVPVLLLGLTPIAENEEASVTEVDKDIDTDASIGSGKAETGVPVLLQGLTPIAENEEASVTEVDKEFDTDASIGSGKAEELSVLKLDLEEHCSIGLPIPEEGTALLLNDKPERLDKGHTENSRLVEHNNQANNEEMENNVLDNDVQWGRRTLQQFLMNLGLL